MVDVAVFEPPGAAQAFDTWKRRHAADLAALPDEDLVIDTGRASEGDDFVRVRVADAHAWRFE